MFYESLNVSLNSFTLHRFGDKESCAVSSQCNFYEMNSFLFAFSLKLISVSLNSSYVGRHVQYWSYVLGHGWRNLFSTEGDSIWHFTTSAIRRTIDRKPFWWNNKQQKERTLPRLSEIYEKCSASWARFIQFSVLQSGVMSVAIRDQILQQIWLANLLTISSPLKATLKSS